MWPVRRRGAPGLPGRVRTTGCGGTLGLPHGLPLRRKPVSPAAPWPVPSASRRASHLPPTAVIDSRVRLMVSTTTGGALPWRRSGGWSSASRDGNGPCARLPAVRTDRVTPASRRWRTRESGPGGGRHGTGHRVRRPIPPRLYLHRRRVGRQWRRRQCRIQHRRGRLGIGRWRRGDRPGRSRLASNHEATGRGRSTAGWRACQYRFWRCLALLRSAAPNRVDRLVVDLVLHDGAEKRHRCLLMSFQRPVQRGRRAVQIGHRAGSAGTSARSSRRVRGRGR